MADMMQVATNFKNQAPTNLDVPMTFMDDTLFVFDQPIAKRYTFRTNSSHYFVVHPNARYLGGNNYLLPRQADWSFRAAYNSRVEIVIALMSTWGPGYDVRLPHMGSWCSRRGRPTTMENRINEAITSLFTVKPYDEGEESQRGLLVTHPMNHILNIPRHSGQSIADRLWFTTYDADLERNQRLHDLDSGLNPFSGSNQWTKLAATELGFGSSMFLHQMNSAERLTFAVRATVHPPERESHTMYPIDVVPSLFFPLSESLVDRCSGIYMAGGTDLYYRGKPLIQEYLPTYTTDGGYWVPVHAVTHTNHEEVAGILSKDAKRYEGLHSLIEFYAERWGPAYSLVQEPGDDEIVF